MKFELHATEDDGASICHEFDAILLGDVLERLETFIQAAGYKLKGHLEVVEDEEVVLDRT